MCVSLLSSKIYSQSKILEALNNFKVFDAQCELGMSE